MAGLSGIGRQSPSLPLQPSQKIQVKAGEFATAMVSASSSQEQILTHLCRDWTLARVNNQLPRIDFSMLVTSPIEYGFPPFSPDSSVSSFDEKAGAKATLELEEPATVQVFVMSNGVFTERRGTLSDTHFTATHVETLGINSDARHKESIEEETQIHNALALGMVVTNISENQLILEKNLPQVQLKFLRGIKSLPNPELSLLTRDQLNDLLYQTLFPQTKLQYSDRTTAAIHLTDYCSDHYKNPSPIDPNILNGKWKLKLLNGSTPPVSVTFEFAVTDNKYTVVRDYEGDITKSSGYVEGATLKGKKAKPAKTTKGAKTLAAEAEAAEVAETAAKTAAAVAVTAAAKAATAAAAAKAAKVAATKALTAENPIAAEKVKAAAKKTLKAAITETTEAARAVKNATEKAAEAAEAAAISVRKTGWSRLGNFLVWDGVPSHPDYSLREIKRRIEESPPKIVSFSDRHLLFANNFVDSYLLIREGVNNIVEYESSTENSEVGYNSIGLEQPDWLPFDEEEYAKEITLRLRELNDEENIESEESLASDSSNEELASKNLKFAK